MKKITLAAISGPMMESYNNMIIGLFSIIISPVFFPQFSFLNHTYLAFLSFAIGFVLRPIGGILFGFISQNYGSKYSLKITMAIFSLTNLIICFCPSYKSIGIWSTIIFFVCRFFQGIVAGSDYTTSITHITEQRGIKDVVFVQCLVVSLGFLGAIVGNVVGIFTIYHNASHNCWRLAFLCSGILSIFIYKLRNSLSEKKEIFQQVIEKKSDTSKKNFFIVCFFGGANLVPIYLGTIFLNGTFKNILGLSPQQILYNNLIILIIGLFSVIVSIKLIKYFGPIKLIKKCMYLYIGLTIPIYFCATFYTTHVSYFILQTFVIVLDGFQVSAITVILPYIFPSNKKYKYLTSSYALGQCILGGFTPIYCSLMVDYTKILWSPGIFLVLISTIYLLCVKNLNFEQDFLPFKN